MNGSTARLTVVTSGLALSILGACEPRNQDAGSPPARAELRDDAILVLERFQIGGIGKADGCGPLLTVHADGSVEASEWFIVETGLRFEPYVDAVAAKRLIATSADAIDEFEPLSLLHCPNVALRVVSGNVTHETCYLGIEVNDRSIGMTETESQEERSKSLRWNAMIDDIVQLAAKK